jgi:hypothetical protein
VKNKYGDINTVTNTVTGTAHGHCPLQTDSYLNKNILAFRGCFLVAAPAPTVVAVRAIGCAVVVFALINIIVLTALFTIGEN